MEERDNVKISKKGSPLCITYILVHYERGIRVVHVVVMIIAKIIWESLKGNWEAALIMRRAESIVWGTAKRKGDCAEDESPKYFHGLQS